LGGNPPPITPTLFNGSVVPRERISVPIPAPIPQVQPPPQHTELKPPIDPSLPLTTLQIRLADGTRLTAQFNLSTPVSEVYSFVSRARPLGGRDFVLQTIFPTRVLERGGKTVEEEGLNNATVVMRWMS
jgi:UBX domain-containing protein 1